MMTSEKRREWRKSDDRKITQPSGGKRNEKNHYDIARFFGDTAGLLPCLW